LLAELAIANASFAIIKQTLANGRELADAGKAVGEYFGAEKTIAKAAASGKGDVLAMFQAKEQLARQEEELKFMLNKQRLQGYADFLKFKAAYSREQKEAELAERKRKAARAKALDENLAVAIKVFGILIVIMAALFGVAVYVR
jgi:hypothetical protein